ncbi:helix-turn-helix domain-containing protein [Saccharopolyspora shandongensis]|uniref:helix-turn-helix domain-containing protein n=1 Tax=Saccharopolyspora shandongensis TaxID=418495 RepID=UPI0033CDB180
MANTPRARALAKELRALRKARGLTLEELAAEVRLSRAKVSRVENAQQGITEVDVATILAGLKVKGADRGRLLKMARELDQPVWWELHSGLTSQITGLIDAEQRATRITEVSMAYVPGLLQTRAYSRAIFVAAEKSPEDVDESVNIRQVRQGVLYKSNPVELRALLDEAVLARPVGGPSTAAEQLRHLLKEMERPNIAIHVLPTSLGAHIGLDGMFSLIEFGRSDATIYVEAHNSGLILNDAEEEGPFRDTVDKLERVMLNADGSARLIARYADKFEGGST